MAKTLLVVDDSTTIQDAVRNALTGEDWAVVAASCETEAMEALRDRHFDAVFCDVALGDADGYEVCKTIRATGEGAELFVVLMGANVSDAAAMAAGASATVLKPFETAEILEVLQTASAPPDFALELVDAVHEDEEEILTLEPLDADASTLEIDKTVEIIDLSEGEDFADLEVLENLAPVEAGVESDTLENGPRTETIPAQPTDVAEPSQADMMDFGLESSAVQAATTVDEVDAGSADAGPGESAAAEPETTAAGAVSFGSPADADMAAESFELEPVEAPTDEFTADAELLPDLSDLGDSVGGDPESSKQEAFELQLEEPSNPLEEEDFLRGAFDLEIDPGGAVLETSEPPPEPKLGEEPGTAEPEWSPPSAVAETDEDATMASGVDEDAVAGLNESLAEGAGDLPSFAAPPEIAEPHDLAASEPFTGVTSDREEAETPASAPPSMPDLSTMPQADAQSPTFDPWAEDTEEWAEPDAGEMPSAGGSSPTELGGEPADGWEDTIPEPLPRVVVESAEKAIREALESSLSAERLAPVMEAVVERVVWEVVPELAERLIQEAIDKLRKEQPPE